MSRQVINTETGLSGSTIQTVLGPIEPRQMRATLVHEHVFIDGSCWFVEPEDRRLSKIAHSEVTLERLSDIRRAYRHSKNNWLLDDPKLAAKELGYFKSAGGGTIFDVTPELPGRDHLKLAEVARKVGINIVAGCGFYVQSSHPPFVARSTVDQLAARIVKDLTKGIGDTKVKAGVIGEIGISPNSMTRDEEKVLRAAAAAQKKTRAPITVHTFEPFDPKRRQALRVLDILEEEGADVNRVYMSHMDALRNRKGPLGADVEHMLEVAERGATLSFDGFGTWEWPVGADCYELIYPTDFERAVAIAKLIENGFEDRIVLSHDVCMKTNLREYGGTGYDHLLVSVPRILRRFGVGDGEIEKMLVENPRRLVS